MANISRKSLSDITDKADSVSNSSLIYFFLPFFCPLRQSVDHWNYAQFSISLVFCVWSFVFPMIPQVQMIRHLLLQFLHKAYLKRNQLIRNYFYCNECIWLALQRLKRKEIARCREISFAYICWFSSSLYPLVAFLKQ